MRNLKNDRGITMIAVIGVVLILSIITVSVMTLTNINLESSTQRRQKDNALYMAESGVNFLLYELKKQNKAPDEYSFPHIIESSVLDVGILEEGDSFSVVFDHEIGNTYRAVSTGISMNITRVINVIIEYIVRSIFPQKYVDLSASSGEEGFYAGYMGNNYIDVTVETVPPGSFSPDPQIKNKDVLNLSGSAEYRYENITINNGGTLNIVGPASVYINGNLSIEGGVLNIQGSDPVEFFIGGDLIMGQSQPSLNIGVPTNIHVNGLIEINNKSNINNRMDPNTPGAQTFIYVNGSLSLKNNTQNDDSTIGRSPASNLVFFFGTGAGLTGGVNLANKTSLTGGIYAPTRIITLNNQASVNGAIVGASFAAASSWDKISWDSSLLDIISDGEGTWEIREWTD